MMEFERKHEPLAPAARFFGRLAMSGLIGALIVGVSLFGGMAGYHYLEGMSWTDAYLNATMILSGMGPVGDLKTESGKLFAGSYALYSGLILVVAAGIVLAPVVHRFLHRFHLDSGSD